MNPIKLILAQSDTQALALLRTSLSFHDDILILAETDDGGQAAELAAHLQPDLLVIGMRMRGLDGLGILARTSRCAPRTRVIVFSAPLDEAAAHQALRLGACCCLSAPDDLPLLPAQIRALCRPGLSLRAPLGAETGFAVPADSPMSRYVSSLLLKLAVPPHLVGHRFLREAILLSVRLPVLPGHMCGDVYPFVARRFSTTACRVERSIRYAIARAWDNGGNTAFSRLLGHSAFLTDRPSNREFIALVAEHVRIEHKS